MNIGIDIRTLSFRKGGISHYTSCLLKTLIRLDTNNHYYFFNFNKSAYDWDTFRENANEIVLRLPQRRGGRTYWGMLFPAFVAWKYNLDLWFSPDFFVPRFLKIPRIVTIHDLIFMNFYNHKSTYSKKLKASVSYAMKHAAKIIVTSHYTLEDLQKFFPINDGKVAIIPLAADDRFHPIEKHLVSMVLKRYSINFPYILFVGEISLRKNLLRLLNAFQLLKKGGRISGIKLLLVGKKTSHTVKIMHEVSKLNISNDVFFAGYIPDEDLPFIYNGAEVFVFPSLYEGFGIPPLEAMRCLTPVAASNATSIPEVVGDACILFDPLDVPDMAEKIDQVINNRINVEDLKKRAKIHAEKFSWEKTARETLAIFKCLNSYRRQI